MKPKTMYRNKSERFNPDREFIANAVTEFLKSGGAILELPPDKSRDEAMVGLTTSGPSPWEKLESTFYR